MLCTNQVEQKLLLFIRNITLNAWCHCQFIPVATDAGTLQPYKRCHRVCGELHETGLQRACVCVCVWPQFSVTHQDGGWLQMVRKMGSLMRGSGAAAGRQAQELGR